MISETFISLFTEAEITVYSNGLVAIDSCDHEPCNDGIGVSLYVNIRDIEKIKYIWETWKRGEDYNGE